MKANKLFLLFIIILSSCNPVKQVMKDNDKVREVFEQGLRKEIISCIKDTPSIVFIPGKIDTIPIKDIVPALDDKILKQKIDSITPIIQSRYKDSIDIDCTKQINDAYDAGYRECRSQIDGKTIEKKSPDTIKIKERDRTYENLLKEDLRKANEKLAVADSTIKDTTHRQRHNPTYNLGMLWVSLSNQWWFWVIIVAVAGYVTRKLWIKFIPAFNLIK